MHYRFSQTDTKMNSLAMLLTLALILGLCFSRAVAVPVVAAASTLSSLKQIGPLIGTFTSGNSSYGQMYLHGVLTDQASGEDVGVANLILKVWPQTEGDITNPAVTKQKFFEFIGRGTISATGSVQVPEGATTWTFIIPITGGTGEFFGAIGSLNTTQVGSLLPNQAIYTLSYIVPVLH